ncbi:hypothetical protein L9F63_015762, partial [Diploptera punctata]
RLVMRRVNLLFFINEVLQVWNRTSQLYPWQDIKPLLYNLSWLVIMVVAYFTFHERNKWLRGVADDQFHRRWPPRSPDLTP